MIDRTTGEFDEGPVSYDIGDDKIYLTIGEPVVGPVVDTSNNRPMVVADDDIISWSFLVPITEWSGDVSQETATFETQGWFLDANIGGATVDLALTDITAYAAPNNSGLDLVVNSANTASVGIACNSTNASDPGDLTCSAGNEEVGVVFNAPYAGIYEACVDFSHEMIGDATENVIVTFQLVETTNSTQTIIQEGGTRLESRSDPGSTAGSDTAIVHPIRVCGIFKFASAGKKTIRLMREQAAAGTGDANRLALDRSAALGQRDAHYTVKSLTQNFTQAVALVGDEYDRGRVMVRQGSTHNGIVVTVTAASGVDTINTTEDVTWLRPFSMLDESGVERWFLEFSISARIVSDITANSTFTINGVDFSDHDNTAFTAFAAAFSRSGGGTRTGEGFIVHNTDTITAENGDSGLGYNRVAVQGTAPLQSKPTWVP